MIPSINHIDQVNRIQSTVSRVTGIKMSDICSKSRKAEHVRARHLSMYFCRYNTEINLQIIARLHSKDNHATVIHACKMIEIESKSNKKISQMIEEINNLL
jgi:chromosomal replication initiator protein